MGLKTRHFGTIISELTSCLRIHATCNSRLGGVSLEFTGELNDEGFSVTECLGGSMELSEEQLGLRYQVCILHAVGCEGLSHIFIVVVLRPEAQFRAVSWYAFASFLLALYSPLLVRRCIPYLKPPQKSATGTKTR
jgi:hypothetical protein